MISATSAIQGTSFSKEELSDAVTQWNQLPTQGGRPMTPSEIKELCAKRGPIFGVAQDANNPKIAQLIREGNFENIEISDLVRYLRSATMFNMLANAAQSGEPMEIDLPKLMTTLVAKLEESGYGVDDRDSNGSTQVYYDANPENKRARQVLTVTKHANARTINLATAERPCEVMLVTEDDNDNTELQLHTLISRESKPSPTWEKILGSNWKNILVA